MLPYIFELQMGLKTESQSQVSSQSHTVSMSISFFPLVSLPRHLQRQPKEPQIKKRRTKNNFMNFLFSFPIVLQSRSLPFPLSSNVGEKSFSFHSPWALTFNFEMK